MSPYLIQTDFALPSGASPVGVSKYNFRDLPVGGMFFVPGRKTNNLSNYASSAGKALGRKFTTRLLWALQRPDGGWSGVDGNGRAVTEKTPGAVLGIGVWRLADPAGAPGPNPNPPVQHEIEDDEIG